MTKRKVVLSILSILAIILSVTFITSCEMQAVQDLEDASVSRRAAPANSNPSANRGPQEFTATIVVYQQEEGKDTFPVGGDRWRTTDEVLKGYVLNSGWDVLSGKSVTMNNFTNFHFSIFGSLELEDMEPILIGNASGTNHSKVEIKDGDSVIMTINANGKLEGTIPFGAQLDMKWNTTGPGPNARGDLAGDFYWLPNEDLIVGLQSVYGLFIPPTSPFGIFTLTGYYNQ